jgi:hypothetical protein
VRLSFEQACAFFDREGPVWDTLRQFASLLRERGIPYAITRRMAFPFHGFNQSIGIIDILVRQDGLDALLESLPSALYVREAPRRIRDTQRGIAIHFDIAGDFPGKAEPNAVRFPDPQATAIEIDGFPVIVLERLIEVDLASGMANPGRLSDLADVQRLIQELGLPRTLGEQLHPYVRDEYYRIWDVSEITYDPSAG